MPNYSTTHLDIGKTIRDHVIIDYFLNTIIRFLLIPLFLHASHFHLGISSLSGNLESTPLSNLTSTIDEETRLVYLLIGNIACPS